MSQSNISLPIYDVTLPPPRVFSTNFTFSRSPEKTINISDRISQKNRIQDEPGKTFSAATPIGIAPLYVNLAFEKPLIQINPNKTSVKMATVNGMILKNYEKLLQVNHLSTNKITENTYIFVNSRDYDVENALIKKMADLNLGELNLGNDDVPKISFIEQAINATLNKGTVFFDKDEIQKPQKLLNILKQVASDYQLSEFYAYKIFLSSLVDPTAQFSFHSLFAETTRQDPESIPRDRSVSDYMIDISNDVDVTADVNKNISIVNGEIHAAIAGFLVRKTELDAQGISTNCTIVVDDGDATHYYDTNINYGLKYSYSISTVYLVQIPTISSDPNSNGKNFFSFLIISPQSISSTSESVDNSPPEPPTDFDLTWSYDKNKLMLSWNFPVQPTRDIRKFQVFRRANIDSPFEMIKQLDFSLTGQGSTNELNIIADQVDARLNFISKNPVTFYVDDDFKKDSKFIYAVVSVSSRGITSGYSSQYEVYFDKFKNSLIKKIISTQNAPKAYPNLYIPNVAFAQTIFAEKFKSMRLIFNPQHLVARYDISDPCIPERLERIVAFDSDLSEYQLSIINADIQQQQTVVVKIKDNRTPDPAANTQLPTSRTSSP